MVIKRLFRLLTPWAHKVSVVIERGIMPPPENQHVNGHKWQYFITINFDRPIPPIGRDQMDSLNSFLLMTETDRPLIGVNFVTIFTDKPAKYDLDELAQTTCQVFDLQLKHLTVA